MLDEEAGATRLELLEVDHLDAEHTTANDELAWRDKCCFLSAVRGTDYFPDAYRHARHGEVWFELVPEPSNIHDPYAIALLLDGKRSGYVARTIARLIQWIVLQLAADNYSCFAPGRIDDMGVVIAMPTIEGFKQFVDPDQQMSELAAIYRDLPEDARVSLEEDGLWYFDSWPSDLWAHWYRRRHLAPTVYLPKTIEDSTVPAVVQDFLWDLRAQRRAARREERERVRREKLMEKERRVAAKSAAEEVLRQSVLGELHGGGSVIGIAKSLGIGEANLDLS